MTIFEKVRALIVRLSPRAICDDCMVDRLDLSDRKVANEKARGLAGMNGFERRIGTCSICGARRTVTSHR